MRRRLNMTLAASDLGGVCGERRGHADAAEKRVSLVRGAAGFAQAAKGARRSPR